MKRVMPLVFVMGSVILFSSCTTKNTGQTGNPPPPPVTPAAPVSGNWPLQFYSNTAAYTVFEPQIDSWNGHEVTARSAVRVQRFGESAATDGAFTFSAITLVDKTTRTAALVDVKISRVDFPTGGSQTQEYLAVLRQEFPGRAQPLALYRLEASLSIAEQHPGANLLNNTPPRVIIATRPAILVCVDGPPVWRPVAGTGLKRVINTRVLLLKDQTGRCYLHLFDGYLQAPSVDGPWTVARHGPAGAGAAEKLALASGQVDLLQGEPDVITHKAPSLSGSPTPDVFVAATPSELITFRGQPDYASIPGTHLLYAVNTSGNVLKLLTDQQNYVLLSGRWYRAPSLNGPWQFVPGNELPREFANIPDTSPKENVKASVPGTPQAAEALMANSIPQCAAVARTIRMQDPRMDGPMQLAPIEGTPLHFVVNSATPIIEVAPQSWYACQNGIWYASTSANGPWAVATSVPAVIYTIPTTSPLHYVTYVHVYGATPDAVYEGYTPGYLGTEAAYDGTVVYGTGYDYAPWIGDEWYGGPVTWGCGFDDCWTPWWGWGFDCGFGWWGCYPPFAWWGGFRHWHDHDGGGWGDHGRGQLAHTGADLYHPHGEAGGNRQNWAGDYGHAYNSRTGQLAAGQSARVRSVSGAAWQRVSHPNYSFQGSRGGMGFNARPRGGGWFHGGGGFFHGGGGGFHGGGGGHGGGGHGR